MNVHECVYTSLIHIEHPSNPHCTFAWTLSSIFSHIDQLFHSLCIWFIYLFIHQSNAKPNRAYVNAAAGMATAVVVSNLYGHLVYDFGDDYRTHKNAHTLSTQNIAHRTDGRSVDRLEYLAVQLYRLKSHNISIHTIRIRKNEPWSVQKSG